MCKGYRKESLYLLNIVSLIRSSPGMSTSLTGFPFWFGEGGRGFSSEASRR